MAILIFTAPEPRLGELHCKEPVSSNSNLTNYLRLIHPMKASLSGDESDDVDVCFVYKNATDRWRNYTDAEEGVDVSVLDYSEAVLVPCEQFIHTGDVRSIITDFDLVCSRTILVALTQTFHLMGVLIGGIVANQMMYRCEEV